MPTEGRYAFLGSSSHLIEMVKNVLGLTMWWSSVFLEGMGASIEVAPRGVKSRV